MHRGRLSARPASAVDARPARDHVAGPDLPRRAGLGDHRLGPHARRRTSSRRCRTLADDAINPVADWFDGLGRANELQDREREAAPAARRGRRARSRRRRPPSAELDRARADRSTSRDIDDCDGGHRRGRSARARATSRARCRSRRAASSGIAVDMPVVVGGDTARPRSSARSCACRRTARPCSASTTATSVSGAQLVQGDAVGPDGHRRRAARQQPPALLGDRRQRRPRAVLKKGDVAVTLGGDRGPVPAGPRRSAPSCTTVGAGGAIARDAELRPIVDLDSLTFVKVLKYPPVPIP